MRAASVTFRAGTDPDLIEAAVWRAKFEISRALSRGEEPGRARQAIIGRFLEELHAESFGEYVDEVLMAAMQRGVEDALVQGPAH
jgi:hypothetical protein